MKLKGERQIFEAYGQGGPLGIIVKGRKISAWYLSLRVVQDGVPEAVEETFLLLLFLSAAEEERENPRRCVQ